MLISNRKTSRKVGIVLVYSHENKNSFLLCGMQIIVRGRLKFPLQCRLSAFFCKFKKLYDMAHHCLCKGLTINQQPCFFRTIVVFNLSEQIYFHIKYTKSLKLFH